MDALQPLPRRDEADEADDAQSMLEEPPSLVVARTSAPEPPEPSEVYAEGVAADNLLFEASASPRADAVQRPESPEGDSTGEAADSGAGVGEAAADLDAAAAAAPAAPLEVSDAVDASSSRTTHQAYIGVRPEQHAPSGALMTTEDNYKEPHGVLMNTDKGEDYRRGEPPSVEHSIGTSTAADPAVLAGVELDVGEVAASTQVTVDVTGPTPEASLKPFPPASCPLAQTSVYTPRELPPELEPHLEFASAEGDNTTPGKKDVLVLGSQPSGMPFTPTMEAAEEGLLGAKGDIGTGKEAKEETPAPEASRAGLLPCPASHDESHDVMPAHSSEDNLLMQAIDGSVAGKDQGIGAAPHRSSKPSPLGYIIAPLDSALLSYCKQVARRPCLLILCYLVLVIIIVILGWRPFELETDFSSFIRADGDAHRRREGYLKALDEKKGWDRRLSETQPQESVFVPEMFGKGRLLQAEMWPEPPPTDPVWYHDVESGEDVYLDVGGELEKAVPADIRNDSARSLGEGRRLYSLFIRQQLTIIYKPPGGNALAESVLLEMRELEDKLRSGSTWRSLCEIHAADPGSRGLCDPGESLLAFAYPSVLPSEQELYRFIFQFDGKGRELLPSNLMLEYMKGKSGSVDVSRYFPKSYTLPVVGATADGDEVIWPEAVRSTFSFRLVVGKTGEPLATIRKGISSMKTAYKNLIKDEVSDVLFDTPNWIYYYGDVIVGYEITQTLMKDSMYAVGSIGFVLFYLVFHTKSILLSFGSLGIIFLSLPVAYVLTPASKTTIASFLSLFLITGIGSDVIFVFTDFWEQSTCTKSTIHERLQYMIKHGGISCLATSLTTAVSFFANLVSVLQPLREFGLFMGLCVMSAFLLVLLMLPPIIVFLEKRRLRRSLRVVHASALRGQQSSGPPAIEDQGQADDSARPAIVSRTSTVRRRNSLSRMCLLKLVNCVAKCPVTLVLFTFVLCLVFIIGISTNAAMDQGVPEIFPPGHNQVEGPKAESKFKVVDKADEWRVDSVTICNAEASVSSSGHSPCDFFWCEAAVATKADVSKNDADTEDTVRLELSKGSCWWNLDSSLESCGSVDVVTRLAGPSAPLESDWWNTWSSMMQQLGGTNTATPRPSGQQLDAPLAIEEWESGKVELTSVFDMGEAIFTVTGEGSSCKADAMCFFGPRRCGLAGWSKLGEITLPQSLPRPRQLVQEPARALTAVPKVRKSIDVTVVFGIRAATYTPLIGAPDEYWSFDPSFEPSNPWAQRAMYSICHDLPDHLLVLPDSTQCWTNHFSDWLTQDGQRFPTRDFDDSIRRWWGTNIVGPTNIWVKDGRVMATMMRFLMNAAHDSSASVGLKYMERWNEFVDGKNALASITANRAWATATLFVRAQAEVAIVASTIETIIISAVCAYVGMLLFTSDPVLSGIVLTLVLGIVSGLAFFMVVIMDWKIGPIEVIALVVFLGYSVTYSLHIAHNYAHVKPNDPELLAVEEDNRSGLPTGHHSSSGRHSARSHKADYVSRARDQRSGDDTSFGAPRPPPCSAGPSDVEEWECSVVPASPSSVAVAVPVKPFTAAEMRRARSRMAILHVGGATFSSAVSTTGSSMFLLWCTLNIFVKLGWVVIAVTVFSIVFALVALPASLMVFGPTPDPCYVRRPREMCLRVWELVVPEKEYNEAEEDPVDEDRDDPNEPLVGAIQHQGTVS